MAKQPQPPVIILPGITATALHDLYPIEPEMVWTAVLNKAHARIALHPDDFRYEALEPARVVPANPFGLVYGDLIEALRHELSARADRPTPVFGFGYDWRQDCGRSADLLGDFIGEVLERTALLPHYRDSPPAEVDLVGHSMGGLIIARHLWSVQEKRKGNPKTRSRVRRVVTLGTPFRGSVDAIQKLSMGMGMLTGPDPKARERESARTIPAIYQLLPSYPAAIDFAPEVSAKDFFKVEAWQPSILATLREYIRLRGAQTTAERMLKGLLDMARAFVASVAALKPATVLPRGPSDWLAIVGINQDTHVQARVVVDPQKKPRFDFPAAANAPWTEATGDNTVPFLGAAPDFLEKERLVCVTKDDLSFWELRDRVLVEGGTLHAFLPKVNLVQRLVSRFLRDDLKWNLQAHRAPGVVTPLWPGWLSVKT